MSNLGPDYPKELAVLFQLKIQDRPEMEFTRSGVTVMDGRKIVAS
jgi:hypothetical protein